MALIHINADGSFEAVAAVDLAPKIAAQKDLIKTLTKEIKFQQKTVEPLKRIAALKLRMQNASSAAAGGKLADQISVLRHRYVLPRNATVLGKQREIAKLEARLKKTQERLAKLQEKHANRLQPKGAAAKKAKVLDEKLSKVNLSKSPRRAVQRKVSFDTEARRAARETTMGIKSKLRELDAKSKEPTKKKPAKSTVKHTGSVKTGAKATVLASIKQIKADIAKGLTGPKLARAQAELKKQRAALRQLRKGESAKNAAAVAPRTKASKAGMGSADKKPSSNEKRIESLRAKLKPLKPGSPEYRQIMTKIKTLQGRSPVGGNR